ncbi:hypothetical protein TNCV_3176091 [Trichonephila clavipes]|nr:hypothetical protein TNCV_3176091 [Trichonephila clavipes]
MRELRCISVLLYVIDWIWHTPDTRSDRAVRSYGCHYRQISYFFVFSPTRPSQGIGCILKDQLKNEFFVLKSFAALEKVVEDAVDSFREALEQTQPLHEALGIEENEFVTR